MKIKATFDSRDLTRAFVRFAEHSKRSTADLMKSEGRALIKDVVDFTPPGKKRAGGVARVRADIRSALVNSRSPGAQDAATAHRSVRNARTGRVKAPAQKIPVRNLAGYIREKVKMVGFLKAGWAAAARKLGARLPAWASQSAPGTVELDTQWPAMRVSADNNVTFASDIKNLDRRINSALKRRLRSLTRRLEYFTQRDARRASFK